MMIRECAAIDIEALDRHMPTRTSAVHESHFAQQQAGRWTYMVAWEEEDTVPVGVCVIRWDGWADDEGLAVPPGLPQVTNLQVHAARRGRGVGTALLESAEERTRSRGFRQLGLAVADDNAEAAKLYARLGYTDSGVRHESRYMDRDDDGNAFEVVEHNVVLIKDLGG